MHVGARNVAVGCEHEVDRQQLAACVSGGLAEDDPLAGDRVTGAATKAALAAAAGTAVLGLTSITSIVNGHDLGLFNVLAPLTNAAWLFGSIILAVSLKRAGKVPPAVAVGLPIAWVATIPLATVGGGVIAGAYYLAVGHLLVNHSTELTAPAAAQPANA